MRAGLRDDIATCPYHAVRLNRGNAMLAGHVLNFWPGCGLLCLCVWMEYGLQTKR